MLGSFAIICLFVSSGIIGVFRDDPQVIAIGVFALRCQCIAFFFQPLSVCTNMMLQSVGESKKASLLSALRSGICFIPLILILPAVMGLRGVQIAQAVADVLTFAISLPLVASFLKKLPVDEGVPAVRLEESDVSA